MDLHRTIYKMYRLRWSVLVIGFFLLFLLFRFTLKYALDEPFAKHGCIRNDGKSHTQNLCDILSQLRWSFFIVRSFTLDTESSLVIIIIQLLLCRIILISGILLVMRGFHLVFMNKSRHWVCSGVAIQIYLKDRTASFWYL